MNCKNVGLIGYGYWGINLARNIFQNESFNLVSICDSTRHRQESARKSYPSANIHSSTHELLSDPNIDAVFIATPVSTHFEIAQVALKSGKDVWLEKPMTQSLDEAIILNDLANKQNRILMIDHTFLYTGAVRKILELVATGEIGDLIYYDSVRTNLGLFQEDVNVIFDLAPHEFSIILALFPEKPIAIRAMGSSYGGLNLESLAYIHLEFPNDVVAHIHLNWMSPVKVRRTLIGGTKKMISYDDLEPSEKIKIYDKGIYSESDNLEQAFSTRGKVKIEYRTGDMLAPKLSQDEALKVAIMEFYDCLNKRKQSISNGEFGIEVMKLLAACQKSLKGNGERIIL